MELPYVDKAALGQTPSYPYPYPSPTTSLDALDGYEPSPTSTPSTSGSLPDALSRERAYFLAQKPNIAKAFAELQILVEHSDFQKNTRWSPALDLVKAQFEEAMYLLEKIDALDAYRDSTHDRLTDASPTP